MNMTDTRSLFRRHAPLFIILGLALLMVGLRSILVAPVSVAPATEPASVFSGARAMAILKDLIGDGAPHPAGSDANRAVRDRIRAQLSTLGVESEIQSDFKCSPLAPGCAFVENVIAVIPGSASTPQDPAILLTSHYDSVPGSPGAGDDLAGAAAMLEITANLKASPVKSDVILLFSDAEETGLRGAMTFIDSHPLMERVGLVVNSEARGVTGPTVMFETGSNNLALVSAYRDAVERPVTSSLIVEMYKRMPNGTDYTAYKLQDIPGLNFAFSQGVSLYHSARDSASRIDVRSIQHQGDNMLAAIRAAGDVPLTSLESEQDATYFDLFGFFMVLWPASLGPVLAGLAVAAILGSMILRRDAAPKQYAWAFLSLLLTLLATVAAGYLLSFPLSQFGALHPLDHPYAWPARIALVAAALLIALAAGKLSVRRAGTVALFHMVWLIFALSGLALSLTIAGASYLFVAPSLVAGITALVALRRRSLSLAAAAGVIAGGYIAIYHFLLLEAVFNFQLSHFKMISLILLVWPFTALAASWFEDSSVSISPAGGVIGTTFAAGLVIAMLVPTYTPDRPRSVNVNYLADLSKQSYQMEIQTLGPVDTDYLQAAGFDSTPQPLQRYGVQPGQAYTLPIGDLGLNGPEIQIARDEQTANGRLIEGTIRSPSGMFYTGLSFSDGSAVNSLRIEQQLVLGDPDRPLSGPVVLRLHGAGTDAKQFSLRLKPDAETDLFAFEQGGLPNNPALEKVQNLRPDDAAPIHFGDHSLIVKPLVPLTP